MSQEIRPKTERISLLEKFTRRDPNGFIKLKIINIQGFSEQQKPLIVVP